MIKNLNKKPIKEIFSTSVRTYYEIPKYQRSYTWQKKRWEQLFSDLIENSKGYFLGSIIYINRVTDTETGNIKLELIDGQQRIITLSLLLLAIYDYVKENKSNLTQYQEEQLSSLKKQFAMIDATTDQYSIPKVIPQIDRENKKDYFKLLVEKKVLVKDDLEDSPRAGTRIIYKAFRYFKENINKYANEEVVNNNSKDVIDSAFKLLDKINSAVLVTIEVSTNADAYMLFTSLNNRGEPLHAIDLIKNNLMSRVDENDPLYNSDKISIKWSDMLKNLGDDPTIQERFLRHYYNAFIQDIHKKANKKTYEFGALATKSTIMNIYEKLINFNYKDLIDGLVEKSNHYAQLINNATEIKEEQKCLIQPLADLEHIQGAPSYLLLLYLVYKREDLQLSYEQIADIVNFLVKFFVRRNLTDVPNTRDLNKIFMGLVSDVSDKNGEEVIKLIKGRLKEKSAQDNDLEEKLKGNIYRNNKEATRFLLCYYEKAHATKDNPRNDLWDKTDKQIYKFTIEHVFPEGDNVPDWWVKMIADGNGGKAKEYLDTHCHVLGNLTLTSYNSKLSNSPFDIKRDKTDTKGNYIGYKNGLKLNETLKSKKQWTIKDIEFRTKELVTWFKDEFKL